MSTSIRWPVALVLALSVAVQTAAVALAVNTTALIMGGTFHPLAEPRDGPEFVTAYLDNAVSSHLDPAFGATAGPVTNAVAVFTPEDFFPLGRLTFDRSVAEGATNLRRCLTATPECVYNTDTAVTPAAGTAAPQPGDVMLVFGYSQSAVIASLVKADLIGEYQVGQPGVAFTLVANPMRPNGGVLMRLRGWPTIPLLGVSFPGASANSGPAFDDGEFVYPSIDIVRQYDGLGGDFPVRPLNLIALVNSLLGYGLLHGETVNVPLADARFQGRQGDTSYYLIESELVPLLQPLALFVPKPILSALDVPLRVIIEDAYERGVGPGTPTPMRWWPVGDPLALAIGLLKSVPVAVDELLDGFGLGRPFGTTTPGPFGVSGPDVAEPVESVAPIVPGEPEAQLSTVELSEAVAEPESPEPEAVTESELPEVEPATEVELAEPDVDGILAEPEQDLATTAADPEESEAGAEAEAEPAAADETGAPAEDETEADAAA